MPNWCAGNIRFRGKLDNIIELLRHNIVCCRYTDEHETETASAKVEYNDDYCEIRVSSPFEEGNLGWFYIDGTRRNFLDLDVCGSEIASVSSYIPDKEENEKSWIFVFENFAAAWSIEPEPYVEMSKEFGVDIKIFGWERGVGFDQEIEVIGGMLIKNYCSEHQDYIDWMWNTALPYMGG